MVTTGRRHAAGASDNNTIHTQGSTTRTEMWTRSEGRVTEALSIWGVRAGLSKEVMLGGEVGES